MDRALGHGHRRCQVDRLVEAVDAHPVAPAALRQAGDLRQYRLAGMVDDVLRQVVEAGQAELLHHLRQALAADIVAGRQRIDVALRVDRQAGVGTDHREQRLVHPAALGQLQHRDVEPLHEHVGAVGAEADAADIHQVAGAGQERHQPAVMEARRGQHEVIEVPGPHPGVVRDVDVAFRHRLGREVPQEMLHRLRHGVDVAGGAGDGLGQHPPLEVEDAGREVAAFAHDRAEGGADQGLRLLLDHGDEAVPHDLGVDLGERVGTAHGACSCWPGACDLAEMTWLEYSAISPIYDARRSSTMLPVAAMRASKRAGT